MIGPKFLVSGLCASVLWVTWPSFATADTLPPLSDTLPPLYGPSGLSFWTLVSFTDGPQDPDAIFRFEGETFSLDVPCFQSPWGYRYDGAFTAISIDGNYTDRCGGTIPPTIVAFDAVMPKVKTLELKGDQLSLADADNRVLLVLQRLEATGLETANGTFPSSMMAPRSSRRTSAFLSPPPSRSCTAMWMVQPGAEGWSAVTLWMERWSQ